MCRCEIPILKPPLLMLLAMLGYAVLAGGCYSNRDRGVQSLISAGRELLAQGKIDEAISKCTEIIEHNNKVAGAFVYRGIAYNFSKRFALADADFERALSLDPSFELARYWQELNRSNQRHVEIGLLFALPGKDAKEIPVRNPDEVIATLIASLGDVQCYRSQLRLLDLTCRELRNKDFETVKWSFDFVGPDRYSILQYTVLENYPDGKAIHWISSRNSSVTPIFDLWAKQDKPTFFGEIERFLSIEKFKEILTMRSFDGKNLSRTSDGQYYVLNARIPSRFALGDWPMLELRRRLARSLYHVFAVALEDGSGYQFGAIPVVSNLVEPHSVSVNPDLEFMPEGFEASLSLWIGLHNLLPTKALIMVSGNLENGEAVILQVEQVFGDFNADVRIVAPTPLG